jgi:hypothetical protein
VFWPEELSNDLSKRANTERAEMREKPFEMGEEERDKISNGGKN